MQLVKRAVHWPYNQATAAGCAVKAKARHIRSILTIDNFKELFRQIFLLISKVFCGLGLVAAFPFFTIEKLISLPARRPTKYSIGNEKSSLSEGQMLAALRKLEKPARKIQRLELLHPKGGKLPYAQSTVRSLRSLMPEQLVIRNSQLPPTVLDTLETSTHYYRYDAGKSTYVLRSKIIHLVLPQNTDEALHTLDELAERGERAVNVYFCREPARYAELRKALAPLRYSTLLDICHAPREAGVLLPLLTLQI